MALIRCNGGGNSNPYVRGSYAFTAFQSRLNYKSGGFYVKNGICYVDMTWTSTGSFGASASVFGSSDCMPSSAQGTTYIELGDIKVKYTTGPNTAFQSVKASSGAGIDYHMVGQYYTTAPDTEPA